MLNAQEHYDLMDQFERDMKPGRNSRESKDLWRLGHLYQDGKVNELFLAYRFGYTYGKTITTPTGGDDGAE